MTIGEAFSRQEGEKKENLNEFRILLSLIAHEEARPWAYRTLKEIYESNKDVYPGCVFLFCLTNLAFKLTALLTL